LHEPKRTELSVRQERAVLVGVILPGADHGGEAPLEELARLAETAGALVVDGLTQKLPRINPGTYVGRGKAEEARDLCAASEADALICDHDLSPGQIHTLEEITGVKVLDRSELILDIFATRARTRQARVQVELAQMEYTYPRLTRMWSHLDRHGGGIGTRGPGERQLESDRRAFGRRVRDLRHELHAIASRTHREAAARSDEFNVGLVGYTNAGKSTLFRALTGADAFVEDRLFATLDTKTRTWALPSGRTALLSDTVGFIRRLPHHLVASFHATLETTTTASLLLHVVDVSHPDCHHQADTVREVLAELGADDRPMLLVLNKMDVAEQSEAADLLRAVSDDYIEVSARTGQGLDRLAARVESFVSACEARVTVRAAHSNGRLLASLHRYGSVLETSPGDGHTVVELRVPPRHLPAIRSAAGPGDSIVVHEAATPSSAL
jgi:GTP-binding protein HflX